MKRLLFIASLYSILLTGCATPNFATSPTPASITADWERFGITEWRKGEIYSIGNLEFGYLKYGPEHTIQVDPGPTAMKVYYYANRGNAQGMFWQTDPMPLSANLKPNGKYKIQGDYGENEVKFRLLDLDSMTTVAEAPPAVVVRRPAPRVENPGYSVPVPVFIRKN